MQNLLAYADVRLDGKRQWDIKVHDDRVYQEILTRGSLGLGEAYMEGWWDCDDLSELFTKILTAELDQKVRPSRLLIDYAKARLFNMQSKNRSFQVGIEHYDLGNEIFTNMLDKRMTYTCGYWTGARTLDEAQEAKLDLACRKIGLKPGMKVLDIGCGWGSFAKFAAQRYDAKVVGVTVSKEQIALGRALCKGLPIEFQLKDYRDITGKFDRVVSLGMIEHVGYKNYREYMRVASNALKEDGLFLLHTIGGNISTKSCDPWIEKYIFPNGMLPSISQLAKAMEGLFVMEDWHNFGADYDRTLMAWHANFIKNWKNLEDRYDQRFYRMWTYYLLTCAGSFRARKNQLWQIVLSKHGAPGGYTRIS